MTTVYFANTGLIDLDVIRVMGVSVKETKSPIGFFGTGLKFAIATLLRHNHTIRLTRGGVHYDFGTEQTTIRGEMVERVFWTCDEWEQREYLPFTTQLGRNWEIWQAYRELHSNTLDEAGVITDSPVSDDTVIQVTGRAFHNQYLERGQIFVDPDETPLISSSQIEVYDRPSSYFYYRGVRAGAVPGSEQTRFTYNILSEMKLTEDRTFASLWDLEWRLQTLLPRLPSAALAHGLLSGSTTWDQSLSLSPSGASEEFVREAERRARDASASKNAARIFRAHQRDSARWTEVTLTDTQQALLLASIATLQSRLDCDLSPEEVMTADTLGPDVMGLFHDETDQIWLARHTFDYGQRFLMAVLYEEWLHKRHGYGDESRSLQSFLIHRLIAETCDITDVPVPQDPELKRILNL